MLVVLRQDVLKLMLQIFAELSCVFPPAKSPMGRRDRLGAVAGALPPAVVGCTAAGAALPALVALAVVKASFCG